MSLEINPYTKVAANIVREASIALSNGIWSFEFELPCAYSRQQLLGLFAEVNRTPNIRSIVYEIPDRKCRGCDADYGKCNCVFEEPGRFVIVKIV